MTTFLLDNSIRCAVMQAIRDEYGGNDKQTQCSRLLAALRRLGSVTTFEASRYLDIYHPPARKLNLVQQGYQIDTVRCIERTESGTPHRVGEYLLVGEPLSKDSSST
jgi:Helix-turn-helix domain